MITSFLVTTKDKNAKEFSIIIIYSNKHNQIIQVINNTFDKYGFKLEEIQVFEPHPYNEAIAFSADSSNGYIVIWDIETGVPLNIF